MKNEDFEKIRAKLDADLASAGDGVGIHMGENIYREFGIRKKLETRKFQPVGVPSVVVPIPTYNGSPVLCNPDLGINDVKAGN